MTGLVVARRRPELPWVVVAEVNENVMGAGWLSDLADEHVEANEREGFLRYRYITGAERVDGDVMVTFAGHVWSDDAAWALAGAA